MVEREQRDEFEKLLNRVMTGEEVDIPAMLSRQRSARPPYQGYLGERIPTQVRFDNEASETRTLIEIETEDRIGLLYAMTLTFTEVALDISAAKICTEKGAAIDTFYVSELGGGKVLSAERQKTIEMKLTEAIHALEDEAPNFGL